MTGRYTVFFTKAAEQKFDDLIEKNRKLGERLSTAIEQLTANPHTGEALSGQWKGYLKYRVGDYRIIYRIQQERLIIYIITIAHRREVYRKI